MKSLTGCLRSTSRVALDLWPRTCSPWTWDHSCHQRYQRHLYRMKVADGLYEVLTSRAAIVQVWSCQTFPQLFGPLFATPALSECRTSHRMRWRFGSAVACSPPHLRSGPVPECYSRSLQSGTQMWAPPRSKSWTRQPGPSVEIVSHLAAVWTRWRH